MNYTVIGRRWFDRINGNTYHSVHVYKNGELIGSIDFDYGYGSMYAQNAMKFILEDRPDLKKRLGEHAPLWKLKELGYTVIDEVTDVSRKKDL